MGDFRDIVCIGFDKNGEADFRIHLRLLADLSVEKMNELRRMIPVTIGEVERIWIARGPLAAERAQCTNSGAAP